MSLKKCERCLGSKEVINLGMMRGPCKVCDAKGYIIAKETPEPILKSKRKLSKDDKLDGKDPEPQAA